MKILLIYPKYPDTFWSFKYSLKFIKRKAAFPPLGLLTIASMLPKQWKKKLIDLNVRSIKDKNIKWADIVFISAMLVQKRSAQMMIRKAKKFGKKVVVGGPAFTTRHEKFEGVDHFVLNEAEITLPQFLSDLEKGNLRKMYTSTKRPDITKTPIPMWSLIKMKDYASMPVQYSRGCPFDCEFCDIVIMNGRIPRTKTPRQMIAEINTLYKSGWRDSVFIVDDNFIGNKVNAKEMLRLLIRWQRKHKYPFRLFTEASINLADDKELMNLMSAANFNKVFLGLETPNPESLKECSKFLNSGKNMAKSVDIIHNHGMQVMGGFIVGFDNDDENIFEAQIKFIQKIGVVTAMVGVLIALPQTRLWHRLKAEGRLIGDSSGENTSSELNFIPKMTQEKLIKGYKKILVNIYSPEQYYKRINVFLKNYKPTTKGKIKMTELGAFFRSVWRIGILSKSRFRYWKIVIKTFFVKPKALPQVVEFTINGQHFERITKRILSSEA